MQGGHLLLPALSAAALRQACQQFRVVGGTGKTVVGQRFQNAMQEGAGAGPARESVQGPRSGWPGIPGGSGQAGFAMLFAQDLDFGSLGGRGSFLLESRVAGDPPGSESGMARGTCRFAGLDDGSRLVVGQCAGPGFQCDGVTAVAELLPMRA